MKKFITLILLAVPMIASADYLDVIEYTINEGCTFEQDLQITKDFNEKWAAKYGYRAELLMPLQSQNLTSYYWVGRTKDAAAFGAAWDAWRNQIADPQSVAGKLSARFLACTTNLSRRGYDTY
ncbi:MAG: hypothetical protein E4H19_09490 [Chromatiales bacterium]|nr:MAG: hypothetical protein E4H19_09490 [Chromatiales bacterium]